MPDSRCDEVLATVGLTESADQRLGGFSMGMRQRLALATTLLGDPQVMLLDEPANGLDPGGIAWLLAVPALPGPGRAARSRCRRTCCPRWSRRSTMWVIIAKGQAGARLVVCDSWRANGRDLRVKIVSPDADGLSRLVRESRVG